jgi:phage shock protein E
MNKRLVLLGAVVTGVVLLAMRGKSTLAPEQARARLEAGAVLVDVRTPEEFADKHLPGAVNIPLDRVRSDITKHVPDKSTVVLLHCRTGRRSGNAEKELRAMGYTNAFNIGSYQQAQTIASP